MAAFGLSAVMDVESELEIWPENQETVAVFYACGTQWQRDGMSGTLTGLRYGDVAATLRMLGVKRRHHTAVFDGVRIMERAALEVLQKGRQQ